MHWFTQYFQKYWFKIYRILFLTNHRLLNFSSSFWFLDVWEHLLFWWFYFSFCFTNGLSSLLLFVHARFHRCWWFFRYPSAFSSFFCPSNRACALFANGRWERLKSWRCDHISMSFVPFLGRELKISEELKYIFFPFLFSTS